MIELDDLRDLPSWVKTLDHLAEHGCRGIVPPYIERALRRRGWWRWM